MTLEDIKHLLSSAAYSWLNRDDNFHKMSLSAISFINNLSGTNFTTDSDLSGSDGWAKEPFAWFIEFFCARQIQSGSPDYWAQCEENYKKAREICIRNKISEPRDGAKSIFGEIEGIYYDS